MEKTLNNVEMSAPGGAVLGSGEYEEPRGDLEEAIAPLWKELFRLDKIGRGENFFELGGNSLSGMDLSEMFANRLGIEVPVLEIFQHPSVAEIAAVIASQQLRLIQGSDDSREPV
jgi:acyl carrier protein